MDVETRRLRIFLAVAHELHFSRAAQRLHLSQPALSAQVRALEEELGVDLFVRTSRQVELTPAGEALLRSAPRALHELEVAAETARQAAAGTVGRLTIASVRTGLAGLLPRIMREFTAAYPQVRFELSQLDTAEQLRALADRRIDVGVVRSASAVGPIELEPLAAEPLMVALPADHRLAADGEVDPAELAGEPFVGWPRHLGPEFFDIVVAYCRDHGFSPAVGTEGADIDSQLALVAAGFGVSLQPSFYASAVPAGVVARPLAGGSPLVELQLAWRRDAPDVVRHLLQAARAVVTQERDQSPSRSRYHSRNWATDASTTSESGPGR